MRRLILILGLAVVLTAAVAACGGSETDGSAASQATTPAATPTQPDAATATPTPQGAEVYQAQCAGCHDAGGGLAGGDAGKVRAVVETGAEGMPAFSATLTPAEIEAVSEYVAGGLQ